MKRLFAFVLGLFGIGIVSADYGMMGPWMMGSGYYGYGMMGWGALIYLLVVINLVFLAIYLYKKIWNKK